MLSNFHTHTTFCDGKDSPEEYVLSAIKKGLTTLGFSAHVPINLVNKWNMQAAKTQDYFVEINRLKQKYAGKIEIYAGFEMDYLPTDDLKNIHQYIELADYTIGSVHYLYDHANAKYYFADGSPEEIALTIKEFANNDNRAFVKTYYQELTRVVHKYKPDIIGHFDIIKKHNRNKMFFDEEAKWYQDIVVQALDAIASINTIVEVSTGGRIRGFIPGTYPSTWILQECLSRNIAITISSDAHQADNLDGFFVETRAALKAIGFTKQRSLRAGKWVDVNL